MPWKETAAQLAFRIWKAATFVVPILDPADENDYEYFRSTVERDLAWVRSLPSDLELDEVARTFRGLLEERLVFVTSARLAQRWSKWAGARHRLLGILPEQAWKPALAELSVQSRKVLASTLQRWRATYAEAENAVAAKEGATVRGLLQKLHSEIDFSRQRNALRVAKYTRLANVCWTLIASFTAGITTILHRWRPGTDLRPVAPLVLLFGLLGGAVSALQQVDQYGEQGQGSLRIREVQLRLRPLIGGMASIVVYSIAQSGLVFEILPGQGTQGMALLQLHVQPDNVPMAYYVLAFLAGFSERFFLRILDNISDRFSDWNGGSPTRKPASTKDGTAPSPSSSR